MTSSRTLVLFVESKTLTTKDTKVHEGKLIDKT
jgi:hypothetical protein